MLEQQRPKNGTNYNMITGINAYIPSVFWVYVMVCYILISTPQSLFFFILERKPIQIQPFSIFYTYKGSQISIIATQITCMVLKKKSYRRRHTRYRLTAIRHSRTFWKWGQNLKREGSWKLFLQLLLVSFFIINFVS